MIVISKILDYESQGMIQSMLKHEMIDQDCLQAVFSLDTFSEETIKEIFYIITGFRSLKSMKESFKYKGGKIRYE